MATATTASIADPVGNTLYSVTETSSKPTDVELDATSGTILAVEVDNTANSSAAFLHLYDAAAVGVTIGTTDESFTFMAPAGTRVTYACPEGADYGTALTAAIVATPGSALGPSATVTAHILCET